MTWDDEDVGMPVGTHYRNTRVLGGWLSLAAQNGWQAITINCMRSREPTGICSESPAKVFACSLELGQRIFAQMGPSFADAVYEL
ncbi:hypothetical protein BM221_003301 [Beauveria bassiana]|uniref:Uncharacterized protein n=1 Tax=Beauveria bassiana TaxID=176275 RepID=A0A2N6NUA0_BEABA|nr:hypothetical protein BM221_003301 [Beauveria bassiana]